MENKADNLIAAIGTFCIMPVFFMVVSGLLYAGLGIKGVNDALDAFMAQSALLRLLMHPVVVLGGPLLSISLNVIPTFRIAIHPGDGALITTITTRMKPLNITVLALSVFLLGAILFYAFGENFRIVPR